MSQFQKQQHADNIKSVLLMCKDSLVSEFEDKLNIPDAFYKAVTQINYGLDANNSLDLYMAVANLEEALHGIHGKRYKTYRRMLLDYMLDETN